jgi:hypothetical protein
MIKMLSARFIPFHVPSYDGAAALQKDTVRFVDETWRAILARSDHETSSLPACAYEPSIIGDNNEIYHRLRHSLSNSALDRVGGKRLAKSSRKPCQKFLNVTMLNWLRSIFSVLT